MKPSPNAFNSVVMTFFIRPWQSNVGEFSVRPWLPLLLGHDKLEWESLQFGLSDLFRFSHEEAEFEGLGFSHCDFSNSAMTKPGTRVFDSATTKIRI